MRKAKNKPTSYSSSSSSPPTPTPSTRSHPIRSAGASFADLLPPSSPPFPPPFPPLHHDQQQRQQQPLTGEPPKTDAGPPSPLLSVSPHGHEKVKIVISDFHLSRGKWLDNGRPNPLEDFHQDRAFKELLDYYSLEHYYQTEVELIINGDFFDPLAVLPLPEVGKKRANLEYPLEVEEKSAIQKFALILKGHPVAFAALREFLARGKRIVFRWGNHDAGLLWPGVQQLLVRELAPPQPEQISFQMQPYLFDRICIEHGHQYEIMNQFDENKIFIEIETPEGPKRIQNLPFGSFFVLGFLNQLKLKRRFINQVFPLSLYLKLSLWVEPLFFFQTVLALVWFFIKMRFVTHPMRLARLRKTFLMIGEAFNEPSLELLAEKRFADPSTSYDVLIMGHNHQAAHRVFPGGKQYVNTGTWIPITSLEMSSLGRQIRRTYALIEYVQQKPRVSLKIWHGLPHVAEDFS